MRRRSDPRTPSFVDRAPHYVRIDLHKQPVPARANRHADESLPPRVWAVVAGLVIVAAGLTLFLMAR